MIMVNKNTRMDFSKIVTATQIAGEDAEDTVLLQRMLQGAKEYLSAQKWCAGIIEEYFGFGVGGVVAIFLFRIIPKADDVDEYIWVIIGDIPTLYITVDAAPNPACALDAYIGAMTEWADAAISGTDVNGLPPVNAEPTPANGASLKRRLAFLDKEILATYQTDLEEC